MKREKHRILQEFLAKGFKKHWSAECIVAEALIKDLELHGGGALLKSYLRRASGSGVILVRMRMKRKGFAGYIAGAFWIF